MGPADRPVEGVVDAYAGPVKDLNSGLALGFFNLKDDVYRPIFAVMRLAHHLPDPAMSAADRDRIQSDVARGLGFHPAAGLKGWIYRLALRYRPSVSYSMILLAGMFIIAWAPVAVVTARRMGFLVLLVFALGATPSTVAAQTFTDLERSVLPFADTLSKDDPALKQERDDLPQAKRSLKDFWDGLAELRSREAAERALKGKLAFGFSGDSTERDAGALYKIDMSGEISRGTYPAELRFQSNVTSQIKDGKSTEDLSRFLVNYDYDFRRTPLEFYAFAERMSDSYMGIDSRTEVGVGMNVHHEFGAWDDGKKATIDAFVASLDDVAATLEHAYPGRVPAMLMKGSRAALRRESDTLWSSIQERTARFDLGLAVSAFSEFERAHVSSDAEADGQLKEDETFPLPARQRFRLTLRPTVEWRPTRTAFVSVMPYWKGPLFGDWKGERDGRRRLDYRWDVFTVVKDDLKVSDTGNETVSLVLQYEYHYDNLPPTLSAADLAMQASQRVTAIVSPAGPRAHHVVRMSLQIGWGG